MNVRITFTKSVQAHNISIVTIEDNEFESEGNAERICLRITNVTERCPNSVTVGRDEEVVIVEDDGKIAVYFNILLSLDLSLYSSSIYNVLLY